MSGDVCRGRLDALEQTWQICGELGRKKLNSRLMTSTVQVFVPPGPVV
ncbi:MAG: hypothetical protein ABIZ05_11285 [Pseudonocardiaceae bacterium]